MIKGICHTNLDEERRLEWPKVFVTVPQPGEMVESLCGKRILRVIRITHTTREIQNGLGKLEPYIKVELNR